MHNQKMEVADMGNQRYNNSIEDTLRNSSLHGDDQADVNGQAGSDTTEELSAQASGFSVCLAVIEELEE